MSEFANGVCSKHTQEVVHLEFLFSISCGFFGFCFMLGKNKPLGDGEKPDG